MPELPDLPKIADSIACGVKDVAEGVIGAGETIADGLKNIVLGSVKSVLSTGKGAADEAVRQTEANISTAKGTVEQSVGSVGRTADKVRSEVMKGADETAGKLKREIERQIR